MELDVILGIVSAVLFVLSTVLGAFWKKGKDKLAKIANLVKQTSELIDKANEVLEDNTVTTEEVQALQKELNDVKLAWKALFEKEVVVA